MTYLVTYGICVDKEPKVGNGTDTIPIKMKLCDAQGRNLSSADVKVRALALGPYPVRSIGRPKQDDEFRYINSHGGEYMYNLHTMGMPPGTLSATYTLTISVSGDPLTHKVPIQIQMRP